MKLELIRRLSLARLSGKYVLLCFSFPSELVEKNVPKEIRDLSLEGTQHVFVVMTRPMGRVFV